MPDHDKPNIVPRLLFCHYNPVDGNARPAPALRMIHIGQRIKEVFDRQPKDHDIMWFADRLNCKRANVYNIFNRATVDVHLLFQISQILEYDFFHDLTNELLKSKGEALDEKQQIYDEMMFSMGRLLQRQLRRVAIEGKAPSYQLNRWEFFKSPLKPEKYTVTVMSGENPDVPQHIHLYSIEEKFELRFTIPIKFDDAPRMMPVISYGNRSTEDTFFDIKLLVEEWFKDSIYNPRIHRGGNRIFARTLYNVLNPFSHLKSESD